MSTHERVQWAGIAGLIGALLLTIGDQCFYFAPVSGSDFLHGFHGIVASQPTARALFGATLGPFGALLYLAGFWHVYTRVRARQPRLAAILSIGLSLCVLVGASYHVLWGTKVLTIQATFDATAVTRPAMAALEAHVHDFAANVFLIAEIIGYPSAGLLAILVIAGRSDYPRWFVLLTPAVPLLLLQFVGPYVPAPLGSLLNGSASNLSFALLFAGSVVTTWNRNVHLAQQVAS